MRNLESKIKSMHAKWRRKECFDRQLTYVQPVSFGIFYFVIFLQPSQLCFYYFICTVLSLLSSQTALCGGLDEIRWAVIWNSTCSLCTVILLRFNLHPVCSVSFLKKNKFRFKGSVSQDFQPPVFFMIRTHLGPW